MPRWTVTSALGGRAGPVNRLSQGEIGWVRVPTRWVCLPVGHLAKGRRTKPAQNVRPSSHRCRYFGIFLNLFLSLHLNFDKIRVPPGARCGLGFAPPPAALLLPADLTPGLHRRLGGSLSLLRGKPEPTPSPASINHSSAWHLGLLSDPGSRNS